MTYLVHLLDFLGRPPTGLVHIGAHIGQEIVQYQPTAMNPVLYVEALPDVFEVLKSIVAQAPGHVAINALCADVDGAEVAFNVASNAGESSSMLPLGRHAEAYPDIEFVSTVTLKTTTVDTLLDDFVRSHPEVERERLNCLVVDTQGCELQVLKGAHRTLSHLDSLYLEASHGGMYQGDCTLDELVDHLRPYGFQLMNLVMNSSGWGNALFLRQR